MTLKELRTAISDIGISYDCEETYCELYNTMVDYWNENQSWIGEELFYDYETLDGIEMRAEEELRNGGLVRLWYFLGDINPNCSNIFRVNAYGNCEDVDMDDMECLKDDLLSVIDDELCEEQDDFEPLEEV